MKNKKYLQFDTILDIILIAVAIYHTIVLHKILEILQK